MAVVKPYLSAIAHILIVAPLALAFSVLLAIANIIGAYIFPRSLLEPKTILITGGSTGIGKSLALQYAKEGITLILLGRDQTRLREVADLCQQKGAFAVTKSLDVTDREGMETFLREAENKYKIDLLIANAGVSAGTLNKDDAGTEEYIYQLYDINITGVLNTIVPIIPLFKAKQQGQIAIVSSLMTYIVNEKPAYASSKACLTHLGQCLRVELMPYNVHVNVICPPYIPTNMTAHNIHKQPKFTVMGAEDFVELVQKQLAENRPIVAPFRVYTPAFARYVVPPALFDLVHRFNAKNTKKKN